MNTDEYLQVLSDALLHLSMAWRAARSHTRPEVPAPRVRKWYFAPRVVWPYNETTYDVAIYRTANFIQNSWIISDIESFQSSRDRAAEAICEACKWQPRLILRAVRRIQAATRWCEKRMKGRKRAAEEILRQQAEAEEELEAMASIDTMAKGTW